MLWIAYLFTPSQHKLTNYHVEHPPSPTHPHTHTRERGKKHIIMLTFLLNIKGKRESMRERERHCHIISQTHTGHTEHKQLYSSAHIFMIAQRSAISLSCLYTKMSTCQHHISSYVAISMFQALRFFFIRFNQKKKVFKYYLEAS